MTAQAAPLSTAAHAGRVPRTVTQTRASTYCYRNAVSPMTTHSSGSLGAGLGDAVQIGTNPHRRQNPG